MVGTLSSQVASADHIDNADTPLEHQTNKNNKNKIFNTNQYGAAAESNIMSERGESQPPKKNRAEKVDIRIILEYSEIKKRAKETAENSNIIARN